jgi:hypothetical protein
VVEAGCKHSTEIARVAAERLSAPEAVATERAHPRADGVSGFLSLGLEYDTNIASDPDDSSADPSEVGDARFASTFELNLERRLQDGWSGGGRLLGFGHFHFSDGRDFDIQLLRGDIHASYAAPA